VSDSIADKIDELLKDDRTFSTRAGLRFMTEVVRDAFKFIEEEKIRQSAADEKNKSIDFRLTNVESALNTFLEMRKKEQEVNEAERSKWRLAILAPTILLVIGEIVKWMVGSR